MVIDLQLNQTCSESQMELISLLLADAKVLLRPLLEFKPAHCHSIIISLPGLLLVALKMG